MPDLRVRCEWRCHTISVCDYRVLAWGWGANWNISASRFVPKGWHYCELAHIFFVSLQVTTWLQKYMQPYRNQSHHPSDLERDIGMYIDQIQQIHDTSYKLNFNLAEDWTYNIWTTEHSFCIFYFGSNLTWTYFYKLRTLSLTWSLHHQLNISCSWCRQWLPRKKPQELSCTIYVLEVKGYTKPI